MQRRCWIILDQFFNGASILMWKLSCDNSTTINWKSNHFRIDENYKWAQIEWKIAFKVLNRPYKIPYKYNAYHLQYIILTTSYGSKHTTFNAILRNMVWVELKMGGKLQISDYKILTSISHFPNFDYTTSICALLQFNRMHISEMLFHVLKICFCHNRRHENEHKNKYENT